MSDLICPSELKKHLAHIPILHSYKKILASYILYDLRNTTAYLCIIKNNKNFIQITIKNLSHEIKNFPFSFSYGI
jgi:hypothetical protein